MRFNFYYFIKNVIFFVWPHRLIVRTQASQAWNSGAIPGEVTIRNLLGGERKMRARRRRAWWREFEIRPAGASEFGGWAK